jgi:serine protease Do
MSSLSAHAFAPLAGEVTALVERLRRSVVVVRDGYGHGSGVIWESDGLIVTNHHVVGHEAAEVELADGRRLTARVVGRDPRHDLAALAVRASGLDTAPVGDARKLRVGELILALGNPLGVRGTATLGIVSADGNGTWMGHARRELLQADVALAPGNSGGPLADTAGRVVGIASMILAPGIAVAVPSHVVRRFVASLQRLKG